VRLPWGDGAPPDRLAVPVGQDADRRAGFDGPFEEVPALLGAVASPLGLRQAPVLAPARTGVGMRVEQPDDVRPPIGREGMELELRRGDFLVHERTR